MGTNDEVNHTSASTMIEITGVDLIAATTGCSRLRSIAEREASSASSTPETNEITSPTATR